MLHLIPCYRLLSTAAAGLAADAHILTRVDLVMASLPPALITCLGARLFVRSRAGVAVAPAAMAALGVSLSFGHTGQPHEHRPSVARRTAAMMKEHSTRHDTSGHIIEPFLC